MNNSEMVGAIISVKGEKTHKVISEGLQVLSKANTKGIGLIIQIPHEFFKGINLPFEVPEDDYAVAQMFLSRNEMKRQESIKRFEDVLIEEKLELLGFREVPVNKGNEDTPFILQAFVRKPSDALRGIEFEKRIYKARKKMEKFCYFASFSSKTIIYKGLVSNLAEFYLDLLDLKVKSAFVLFEAKDGSWQTIGPNKYIASIGEISSIKGNVIKAKARYDNIFTSTTSMGQFDDMLEYMHMNDRDIVESIMVLRSINTKKANEFYAYNRLIMEPWEGTGLILFTDGECVGGYLDDDSSYNARFVLTKDGYIYLTSFDVDEFNISAKNRLKPGQVLYVDTMRAQIVKHKEILDKYTLNQPYGEWLDYLVDVSQIEVDDVATDISTHINNDIIHMCETSLENDKVLFMGGHNSTIGRANLDVYLGKQGDLFKISKHLCAKLKCPIIDNKTLEQVKALSRMNFKIEEIETNDVDEAFMKIRGAILNGVDVVILKMENIYELLELLEDDLNKNKIRNKVSLILKTDIYSSYEMAYLLSKGINAINPTGAFSIINGLVKNRIIKMNYDEAAKNYMRAIKNSLAKIILSLGIHSVQTFIGSNMLERKEDKKAINPLMIYKLQSACQKNDYEQFLEYAKGMSKEIKGVNEEISLQGVESIECISKRLKCNADVSIEAKKCIDNVFGQNVLEITPGRYDLTLEKIKSAKEIIINLNIGGDYISNVDIILAKEYNVLPLIPLMIPKVHQDVYNRNDLYQLIYDLKQINNCYIALKMNDIENIDYLVSSGVDEIIICGNDAYNLLNKAHIALSKKNLRNKIVLAMEYDFKNADDIITAALVGCNKFVLTKIPQIVLGCVMLGKCGSECVSGVAKGSSNFKGKEEHLNNFVHLLARQIRERMAILGYHSLDEMNGFKYECGNVSDSSLDDRMLVPLALNTIKDGNKVYIDLAINYENSVSTKLSSMAGNLAEDTININCLGHAGNSFGAFLAKGISLNLYGDSLDYLGKGMCGGKISVRLSNKSNLSDDKNMIVGNGCLYGASSGSVYLDGVAGERFAICNRGAKAILLGMGEYGCAYMTEGIVISLGDVGDNFAYGMTGGIAYIYDESDDNVNRINLDFVDVLPIDSADVKFIMDSIDELILKTDSRRGKALMKFLSTQRFIKVVPREYKRINDAIREYEKEGFTRDEAIYKVVEKCESH